jgi:NIMA (never in mitosis gene a)-related kinase
MEFANNGDLENLISEHKKQNLPVSESFIWETLHSLLGALAYLNKKTVVHRDIKCANIFIHSDNEGEENKNLNLISKVETSKNSNDI